MVQWIGRALNRFRASGLDALLRIFFNPVDELDFSILKRVVGVVSDVEGGGFKYLRHYRLQELPSCDAGRHFWIVECLAKGNVILPVFVKVGGVARRRFKVARFLSGLDLPIPRFYGVFLVRGRTVAFWRYHEGICIQGFRHFTDAQLCAAARAIAKFNVAGNQCASERAVNVSPFWADKIAHKVHALKSSYPALMAHGELIDCFSRFECQLLEVLSAGGRAMLNHNDFKASNMLFLERGDCLITDLDSAALGPVGASLRCFSILPFDKRVLLVNEYVAQLDLLGVTASVELIHKVMCIQQVFWGFHTGVRLLDVTRIERTLRLFVNLFVLEGDALVLKVGDYKF